MTDLVMHNVIALLAEKKNLTREMATRAFQVIMNGGATPAQMAAFLMGLREKGETIDEITAGAVALRAKAQKIQAPPGCIDTCGTGGDATGSYNISTAAAFVLAACGVPVAKHGNRSVSSRSGSADVLQALGVKIDMEIPVVQRCLAEANIAFLMAPRFHPAMRHVAPVRQELGIRTVFNLLGPLSNPAAPEFQLLGVYAKAWIEPMAYALKELGCNAAWVVHGEGGMDELSLSGNSSVAELKDGSVRLFEVTPEEAGLPRASAEALKGGDAEHNSKALMHALSGAKSAYRDAVVYNAAAGLLIAGKAADLAAGANLAAEAIDAGKAYSTLKKLVEMSHERRDTLQAICADTRTHIAQCKSRITESALLTQAKKADVPRGFRRALMQNIGQGGIGLIAEIKKASPSVGIIREDFDPNTLAAAYEAGGATCLSVLTDIAYFQGADAYLQQARAAVSLPVLRKDFMLDPYQIIESRALGADCILLIMAALSDAQAAELEKTARELGMDILVEAHDRAELDRALTMLSPQMLGINNRNLKTLKVDIATSETLAKHIPSPILPICESGIRTHDDITRMQRAGIDCFLVGESLMREADVTAATKQLLGR